MQKIKARLKNKVYPILWSIIILLSVYILLRFAAISFSEDMGQATFRMALASKFCSSMIQAESRLISYSATEETDGSPFPVSLVDQGIPVKKFLESNSTITADNNKEAFINNSSEELYADEEELKDSIETFEDNRTEMDNDPGIYEIDSNNLGLEYLLTNGAVLQSLTTGILLGDEKLIDGQLQIGYLAGNISQNDIRDDIEAGEEIIEAVTTGDNLEFTLDQLKDINYLVTNFYFVDASTAVSETLFDAEKLLSKDMTMKQSNEAPQILIYHTHSKEAFVDSRPGEKADTVIGTGDYLAKILSEDYGYNVLHDTTSYDTLNPSKGYKDPYTEALKGLNKILEENPTIEVMIDLHRNSGEAKTTMIDGRETAQIMMFNGLCRDHIGPLTNLENPYLQDNLALSFQLQIKSKELYPGLFLKNYLKNYRYNLHLRPKSMLVELGTVGNTLESAMNAMVPFAKILDDVLQGE